MQLVGVSFPRSGHHYLVRLLAAIVADDFSYCEFYGPAGCCRALPCSRPRAPFHLQKNHDFELSVPKTLRGCLYIIQHREPVGAAISDRELYIRVEGASVGASRDEYEVWLGRKAAHFVGFIRRWVQAPPPNSVIIDYRELHADPEATLARLFAAANLSVPATAIQAATKSLARVGDFGVADSFVPRPIDQRPGFDGELLARYESLIVDELPEYAATRTFPAIARDASGLFEIAYAAATAELAGDAATAVAAVDRGLVVSPAHPMFLHWRGRLAWRAGDLPLARHYCAAAVERFPEHPLLRVELAQIAFAQGDFAVARSNIEGLRQLRTPDPGHEVLLAMILARGGDHAATRAQIDHARTRRPAEAEHWVYLVRAALTAHDASLARNVADEALSIWPQHPLLVACEVELEQLS